MCCGDQVPATDKLVCELGMGPRTQSEVLGGFEGSANLYTLVNLDGAVCACTPSIVNFHLYQWKKRRQTQPFVSGFYLSPMCRCCWRQWLLSGNLSDRLRQCPLSSAYISGIYAQCHYCWTHKKRKQQPHRPAWAEILSPRVSSGDWTVLNQRGWRRQSCS